MPDGILVGVNDAFLKLFEYTREEVMGKTSVDLGISDPDSRAKVAAELRERGSVQDFEAIRTTKSGARRILSLNLDWVSISGQEHILTTIRDITERKQAEEALRESEQRFRLALRNAPVSVAAQDRDLRFLWAYNQRTVDPGAVLGKTDTDLFPPEDAAHLMALKRKVLETDTEIREQLWITSGGRRVFLDLYLEPMRDEAGQVVGVGIATVDQTPMKLVEEELRESEEKYRSLVKYAPAAIYEMDLQGAQFLSVNDAMCDSLQYSKEELLSIKPADLLDEESRSRFQSRIRGKLAGERIDEGIEYRIRRKDGDWIYAVVNVGAFTYTNENPPRVTVIAHDITERKRAEERKQQHAEELRAMNEELTRFNTAMVGRELRMIELKQEVNELCQRAGLPQRYALDLAREGP
jgi:PAS domain S-box-containing protein